MEQEVVVVVVPVVECHLLMNSNSKNNHIIIIILIHIIIPPPPPPIININVTNNNILSFPPSPQWITIMVMDLVLVNHPLPHKLNITIETTFSNNRTFIEGKAKENKGHLMIGSDQRKVEQKIRGNLSRPTKKSMYM